MSLCKSCKKGLLSWSYINYETDECLKCKRIISSIKKKIIVYTIAYYPLVGGAEIALRQVMKRLKDKYDFVVITAKLQKDNRSGFVDDVYVKKLGLGVLWFDKLFFLPLAVLYSFFIKADLYFGLLENQAGLTALFVSKIKNKPCIVNLQSGDSEEWMKQKMGVFYFLYKLVYNKRAKYIVLSKYLNKRGLSHGVPEENITIIPNGVDTKTFYPIKKTTLNPVILTTGRLTFKNGTDTLIKAFSLIQKKYSDSQLIICGSGEEKDKLVKLADSLKIRNKVIFVGNISYEMLSLYYVSASVFVRPSRSEGFGNSFIEAMSCGIPIIGTDVGGIPDFLEDGVTGLFCKIDDEVDLSKKIVLLLENETLKNKLIKNGLELTKNYDWDIIAHKFDVQFKKLVEV